MAETVLIVDDEESVRRTFADWLKGMPGVEAHAVADAEQALQFVNSHSVDLAVLDWNLGSGTDGLQLLQDMHLFVPDVVAIMVTGFAHQATPLHAMRMGVRDYLDKNQDLNRDTFLKAVRRQLDFIAPAKKQRRFQQGLGIFKQAVEKAVPLIESAATLNAPAGGGIRPAFLELAKLAAKADHAVLILRHGDKVEAFAGDDEAIDWDAGTFGKSLAMAAMMSQRGVHLPVNEVDETIRLQPFESFFAEILAVPLLNEPGRQAVLKLYAKQPGGLANARSLGNALGTLGGEIVRLSSAETGRNRALLEALDAARKAGDDLAPAATVERTIGATVAKNLGGDSALKLAKRIHEIVERHGEPAAEHCGALLDAAAKLMDKLNPSSRF